MKTNCIPAHMLLETYYMILWKHGKLIYLAHLQTKTVKKKLKIVSKIFYKIQ